MTQQLTRPAASRAKQGSGWPVAIGLIALSLVPVIAGALRLTDLAGGVETAENARFFDSPVPLIAHIVGASLYCLGGALQFVPSLRKHRWHRYAGRLLAPAGIIAGFSGTWMAVFYPRPALDVGLRVTFGILMVAFIAIGLRAVLHKNYTAHRAWMIRGYAVGIGAGTQVLTALVWFLISGDENPGEYAEWALLAAGWVINLAVAEVAIRRSARPARSVR